MDFQSVVALSTSPYLLLGPTSNQMSSCNNKNNDLEKGSSANTSTSGGDTQGPHTDETLLASYRKPTRRSAESALGDQYRSDPRSSTGVHSGDSMTRIWSGFKWPETKSAASSSKAPYTTRSDDLESARPTDNREPNSEPRGWRGFLPSFGNQGSSPKDSDLV
jgi:hypothetical protein